MGASVSTLDAKDSRRESQKPPEDSDKQKSEENAEEEQEVRRQWRSVVVERPRDIMH